MPPPTNPFRPYADVHVDLNGPGDARPTALQVVEREGLTDGKLRGKVFLVTGCSAGIGIDTAKALHATGADVYMTVRQEKREIGEKAIQDIRSSSPGNGKLELVFVELTSFQSIRAGAQDLLKKTQSLNALVLNAGIMFCPQGLTEDGFETQMGTNHFGHFLLFQLLKERLLESATPAYSSRVVVVSSAGHRFSTIKFEDINYKARAYNPTEAYGQSKTANVYMANSIERHYGSQHLHATSVHPGAILDTQLGRHMDKQALLKNVDMKALMMTAKSMPQGAATQVWAAVAPHFNDRGGVYLADVGECGPMDPSGSPAQPGYAPHAYDEEAEEKLWQLSCNAVGVGYD